MGQLTVKCKTLRINLTDIYNLKSKLFLMLQGTLLWCQFIWRLVRYKFMARWLSCFYVEWLIVKLNVLLTGERWVPDSCCRPIYNDTFGLVEGSGYEYPASINCAKSHNPSLWWSHGCLDAIQMWVLHRLHVVGAVGLVIAFIQV